MFTLNLMSGNAPRAISQNLCSCERMSVPTASGLTRAVTWLANSGAKTS
jgi:hypothetical protein